MTHEYFFELLTEEIPAWMLDAQLASLRTSLENIHRSIAGETAKSEVIVGATPRRIFFRLAGLPERTPDREEEVKGPPRKIAYDASGHPTAALNGFLKKNAATVDDILGSAHDDYVRLRRVVPGRAAAEILQETIPPVIESLRWPKMMRWGRGDHSYIRPIHSVVSLLGTAPVPVAIFGVASGTTTTGHRVIARQTITVSSYDDYVARLRAAHVVVHAEERVDAMRARCHELATEVSGTPADDEKIWEQWKYLTECPGIVRSEFDRDFLALPKEVLTTVMRVHQKQLPITLGETLTSSFLAVMDHHSDLDGNIASGNAFVTNARFADARFFYQTDRKRTLAERIAQLSHLQFQEKLGDYEKKTRRIAVIAAEIHEECGSKSDASRVARAAELCKSDLVTEMVKEFTELQGNIGGIYAREEGEPDEVWQAIYDHYLPVSAEGEVPRGEVGAIVSLADRIDTLAGFFLLGFKPSGSRDPFALRRAAQGAVQILFNRSGGHIDLPIDRLIDFGLEAYGKNPASESNVRDELRDFFAERVRTLLEGPFAFAYDEVAAAMESGWSNSLTDLFDRVTALQSIRDSSQFLSILDSAKRIDNITAGAPRIDVDARLLEHASEKRLFDLSQPVADQIDDLIAHRQYRAALESFAGMARELETFFNEVMVMVENLEVRHNRMALLRKVGNLARRIGDVTKIVVDRRDYDATRE